MPTSAEIGGHSRLVDLSDRWSCSVAVIRNTSRVRRVVPIGHGQEGQYPEKAVITLVS
jgi:hypothetical protein